MVFFVVHTLSSDNHPKAGAQRWQNVKKSLKRSEQNTTSGYFRFRCSNLFFLPRGQTERWLLLWTGFVDSVRGVCGTWASMTPECCGCAILAFPPYVAQLRIIDRLIMPLAGWHVTPLGRTSGPSHDRQDLAQLDPVNRSNVKTQTSCWFALSANIERSCLSKARTHTPLLVQTTDTTNQETMWTPVSSPTRRVWLLDAPDATTTWHPPYELCGRCYLQGNSRRSWGETWAA